MISVFVKGLKKLFGSAGEITFLGTCLWQYVAIILLLLAGVLFAKGILLLFKKVAEKKGKLLSKEEYTYCFIITGLFIFAESALSLPLNLFWGAIFPILRVVFTVTCLLWVNWLLDFIFILVRERLKKVGWDQLGILQVLRGVAKFILLGFTLLLVVGLLFTNAAFGQWITGITIGASTLTAAVAFASKDMISNFFGALVITVGKPFTIGDWITVNKLEGRVVGIDMRATQLRTNVGNVIYIPNSLFISKHVSNYGPTVYTRIATEMLLAGTNADKLHTFLEKVNNIIKEHPFLVTESCKMHMEDVKGKKAQFVLHLFFKQTKETEKICHTHALLRDIIALGEKEGIELG